MNVEITVGDLLFGLTEARRLSTAELEKATGTELAELRQHIRLCDRRIETLLTASTAVAEKAVERKAPAAKSSTATAHVSGGAVLKAEDERRFLLCVVYSPNKLPATGADGRLDVASPDVLERAAWKFALNGLRVGVGHKPGGEDAARVVENFIWRGAPWHVMGPDGQEQVIEAGDWLVGMILSKKAWAEYKAGRFGGVSLQGTAQRKPATVETLSRQRT